MTMQSCPFPVIHPLRISATEKHSDDQNANEKSDELVAQKWKKLGIEPSELSDDSMFLRRVSIDITGTLPAPDEIREFLSSTNSNKRSTKIDELLETSGYAAWWTTFLCDMTANNTTQLRNISYDNNAASQQWYDWIYKRVEQNTPYDKMISGIVLGVSREPSESYIDYCERMTKMSQDESFASTDSMPLPPKVCLRQLASTFPANSGAHQRSTRDQRRVAATTTLAACLC